MKELNEGIYSYYVYILTNKYRSTYYVGVTSNLPKRINEHTKQTHKNSFTSRYNLVYLVYYEKYTWIQEAIHREKVIKKWNRPKKMDLIRTMNPNFAFLNSLFCTEYGNDKP